MISIKLLAVLKFNQQDDGNRNDDNQEDGVAEGTTENTEFINISKIR
jgi:hypothetical protein